MYRPKATRLILALAVVGTLALVIALNSGLAQSAPTATVVPRASIVQSATAPQATSQYELKLVSTYGWGSLADSVAHMTDLERRHGAGVLGLKVVGLAVGPRGHVYVLDWDYQKIVEFDSDGVYQRIIMGGYGQGPGEFIRPWSLAISPSGLLAVLDAGTRRVSFFDTEEGFQDSFQIDFRAMDVAFALGGVLVTRWYGAAGYSATLFQQDGTILREILPVTEREAEFSAFGEPGIMAPTARGALFASPVVGRWRGLDDPPSASRGVELFPDTRLLHSEIEPSGFESRQVAVGPRGIGVTPVGETVLFYQISPLPDADPEELGEPGHWVARFDREGDYQGSSPLFSDGLFRSRFTLSPHTGNLFAFQLEPYPHVREYELILIGQ